MGRTCGYRAAKPNVILIQVDQYRASLLSLLGNRNVKTPNLDALVKEDNGTVFTTAWCQNPLCLPSRVSMLSGQYPSRTRQYGFDGFCDKDIPLIPTTLKENGYTTGAFGKFHVMSLGLDRWDFDVAAPTLPEEEWLARPFGYSYRTYCESRGLEWPTDQIHGHNPYADKTKHYADKPKHNEVKEHHFVKSSQMSSVPIEHSLETYTTNCCIDFISDPKNHTRPFFAWVTYDRPHHPTSLPKELFSEIDPGRLELEVQCREQDLLRQPSRVLFTQGAIMSVDMVGEEKFRFVLATYIRLIEWIDSEVGRIVKTLRDLGLDEDTAIFFTADHGDEGGFNGIYGKARACKSEGITAVPFVVRPPKNLLTVPADRKYINEPVEVVDIFATICSFAGIEAPKGVQGVSLAEVISGARDEDLTRAVFCESFDQKSLKKEGWKLVFDREDDRDCFLFDMNNDPNQLCDLYNDKSMLKKRIELKREIFSRLMQNVHGDYDSFDVQRVERGLNPEDLLIPCLNHSVDTMTSMRCAAFINHDKYCVLIRYYSEQILLFTREKYLTRDMAMEPDLELVEKMLDKGIRECSDRISYISILRGGA